MEIEVTRPNQFADKARDYRLLADDKVIALLKRGTTIKITLPEGCKKLKATIDWCSSPDFDVSDLQSGRVIVKNTFSSDVFKSTLMPLYYITFGYKKYLKIESI